MAEYSEGWITVPGIGKRYRLSDGSYKETNPFNRFDKPGMRSGSPGFDEGVSQLLTNFGFGGQRRDYKEVEAARNKRNSELLPEGTKIGRLPVSQGGKPTFGKEGINPRDGRPYSESPGKSGVEPPDTNTSNRNDTRVIPGSGGQTQTGTNMGAIKMPGLEDADLSGIANFNGPSFPTQAGTNKISDGYANTSGATGNDEAILYAQSRGGLDGFTGSTTDEALLYAQSRGGLDGFKPGGKFSGAPTATDGQSAPKGGGLEAALADTESMRFKAPEKTEDPNKSGVYDDFGGNNPASYALSGEEMRRRAAFLDEPDSMKAMQNVAAGLGMGNQGLRNFANVDGKAVEMNSADRRAILQAAPGEAQALKDKWVSKIQSETKEEPQTASSAQNPTIPSGTATFGEDKEVSLPGDAKGIDYLNNNDNDVTHQGRGGTSIPESFKADNDQYNKFKAEKFYLK